MKLGLQLWSINDITKEKGIKASIRLAEILGFEGIEFVGIDSFSAEEAKATLDEAGLVCCGAHVTEALLRDSFDDVLSRLKTLGAPSVCVGCRFYEGADDVKSFAKFMNETGKRLKAEGIRLGYHNHDHEFAEYDGKKIIDILLESCDSENVFFELDTRHVAIGGSSPREYAKKYSGRIPFLHARDTDMKEDTAIGCGVVDFKAVKEAAGQVEWIIVENPWLGSNLEQLRTSVKYLNDNLLNMG